MKAFLGWCLRWGGLLPPAWLTYHGALALRSQVFAPGAAGPFWQGCAIILAGVFIRWSLAKACKRDPLEFVDTLEHEMTHAMFGYLTGHPPTSLKATLRKGGAVVLGGRNPFIVLSPYVFPLYAGVLGLAMPLLHSGALEWGRWIWPALMGSFLYRWIREMHPGQSDFSEYGWVFSGLFIAAWMPLLGLGLLYWTGWLGDGFLPAAGAEMSASLEALGRLGATGAIPWFPKSP